VGLVRPFFVSAHYTSRLRFLDITSLPAQNHLPSRQSGSSNRSAGIRRIPTHGHA